MVTPIQWLKVKLMTDGLSISREARKKLSSCDGRRPLTLHDYASTSGIPIELEDDIWVNAPIWDYNPNFVAHPPHRLEFKDGVFLVLSDGVEVEAKPVPVPEYYDELNSQGEPYASYGITHTDRIRISPIEGCSFACRFCDSSFRYHYRKKSIEGLIEIVDVAIRDTVLPAKHILISGGTPSEEDYVYMNEVYTRVARAFPKLDVDIMATPVPRFLNIESLLDAGVHSLTVNIEIFNRELRQKLIPQKNRVPFEGWLSFIESAVKAFGPARVRSLLVVGLEPVEDTVKGVEVLAQIGCEPVLSPFRPDPATPLGKMMPPSAEDLIEAYERSVEAAARYDVKLGPRCIPCHHNTLTFPDGSDYYYRH